MVVGASVVVGTSVDVEAEVAVGTSVVGANVVASSLQRHRSKDLQEPELRPLLLNFREPPSK
jgi:hypothetical protein